MNKYIFLILTFPLLSSCVQSPVQKTNNKVDWSLQKNFNSNKMTASEIQQNKIDLSLKTKFTNTPPAQILEQPPAMAIKAKKPVFSGQDLVISAENMSLPAFVNEIFGNLLGTNFVLDKKLQKNKDRVTMRVTEPQTPENLYKLTKQVLFDYGIEVTEEDNFIRISLSTKVSSKPPLLVSGATLPSVPLSHRPIFQLVPLKIVRSSLIIRWLTDAYANKKLRIKDNPQRNAILLIGADQNVKEAIRAIEFFDKPYMRGRKSLRIEPAFLSADELAQLLVDSLTAQGYGASRSLSSSGSILILPVKKSNMVLLFATDQSVLEHARKWAISLDKPNLQAGNKSLFFYSVKNTRAESIATTLNSLLNGIGAQKKSGSSLPQTTNTTSRRGQSGATIMVDEDRNALLFKGEPADWQRIMALIQNMDVPAKQVLVEVTIAEVNLTETEKFGVEWFAKGDTGRFGGNFTSQPVESIGGVGLNWVLDVAGGTAANLNAYATDSRVKVLSTPRLVVKTGTTANFDVVTEIPTVTGRRNSAQLTAGTSDIIQEIVYRKTGIVLAIEPIVHAGDRVELNVSQQVSETLPLEAGGTTDSPAIFSRNVQTSLTLKSGGSVFLAGLISNRQTKADAGIPILKDLPFIGYLFKSEKIDKSRTELIITITPYILNDENDAQSITDSLIKGLKLVDETPFIR